MVNGRNFTAKNAENTKREEGIDRMRRRSMEKADHGFPEFHGWGGEGFNREICGIRERG